jgi:hypothetical protein
MALAYVELEGADGGDIHLRVDIGSNRYYAYAIGDARTASRVGDFDVLTDTSTRSPLIRVSPEQRGRALLSIPANAFDDEHRAVQIASFREQSMVGPAYSNLVRVPKGIAAEDLPSLTFSTDAAPIRAVVHRPPRRPMASAMFLQALIPLLPTLIPACAGNAVRLRTCRESSLQRRLGGRGRRRRLIDHLRAAATAERAGDR